MQRQRGELVPVAKALADLGGPVQAIRHATPQALHHYTRFDQVNQLVGASEAGPDLGHRPLAGLDLAGLGHRDTPDDPEHVCPCTASVAQ